MAKLSKDMPWVIFYLMDGQFAVSANHVREMVAMPRVVPLPQTPFYIRGVINLRGKVIPVMDLRVKMEMASLMDETDKLIQLMEAREEDHKHWIEELEASVREERKFKLATDPHQCAFGIWYDQFQTDNRILESCLKKFEQPHKKIHAIALTVKGLVEKKDFDSAYSLIAQTREVELKEMISLFKEVRSLLKESNREIALVLEWEEETMVISVDSVAAVEKIAVSDIEEMPEMKFITNGECFAGMGKRGKDNDLVQLFNVGNLISKEKKVLQQIEKKE